MDPRRRAFVATLSAALATRSFPASAQQASSLRIVGVLMGLANDAEAQVRAKIIEQGLAKRGWVVGQNLRIEYRYANSDQRLMQTFAAELVGLKCDCILGQSTPVVAALKKATQTIPVVFVAVSDPIGSGFVESLARPGGNVTGFTNLLPTITGKYLSILRELKPQLTRVAAMYNPESVPKGEAVYLPTFIESAKDFHITVITAEVHSSDEIETAMADLGAAPGSGLIVMPDNFTSFHRELIVLLAARLRIPAIYPYRYFVNEGGLLSYGIDVLDLYRRAPDYIDRILHGTTPSDLPVQAPKKFELVINLKTARTLGLVVPRILLAGADALIE
ncbi:MAG TPA: ABC transporter substrate-binding protein [Xanthobacteraceae bacterium]|jgi:putative ABC transport system substrate-binding protein|nr:ABC transporter substrate-binding protein [Xanthobacteraceae bacterium]